MELVNMTPKYNINRENRSQINTIISPIKKDDEKSSFKDVMESNSTDKNVAFENSLALTSTLIDPAMAREITAITKEDMVKMDPGNIKKISSEERKVILKLL